MNRPAMTAMLWSFLSLAGTVVAAPPDLRGITYEQHPGHSLPLAGMLRDEHGAQARLSDLVRNKPLVLTLGYFHCPSLCSVVRADLLRALKRSGLVAGRDYTLLSVGIDPTETPKDAAAAKLADMERFPVAGAEQGWHFLTGPPATVQAIANAVGFRDRFDPQLRQFLHPTGVVFITPAGVISSYLLGVGYPAGDVRLAIDRANRGTLQAAALPVLLLCFDYNASTGRYSLAIMKLLRLAAAITVLVLGGTLFLATRHGRSPI